MVLCNEQVSAATCTMQAENQGMKQAIAGLVAVPLLFGAQAANAITSQQVRSLTYEEIKGTGLANRCTELAGSNGEITINSANKFKIADLCLEPKSFQIEQEVNAKRKGGVSKGKFYAPFLFMHHFYSFVVHSYPCSVCVLAGSKFRETHLYMIKAAAVAG